MATTYTDATGAPIDAAFLAEIESYLASYGLKVTKARATRATSTETPTGRTDGAELVTVRRTRTSKRHGSCTAHYRVPGMREPVCIAADHDETGQAIGPEWSDVDTVLAFAADVGARTSTAGATLRAIAAREAVERHASHNPTDAYVPNGATYRGAPDCWHCERQYRDNAAGTPSTEAPMPWSIPSSTYNAEQARKLAEQARMRKMPHPFAPRNGYQYATECETCTMSKHKEIHTIEAIA